MTGSARGDFFPCVFTHLVWTMNGTAPPVKNSKFTAFLSGFCVDSPNYERPNRYRAVRQRIACIEHSRGHFFNVLTLHLFLAASQVGPSVGRRLNLLVFHRKLLQLLFFEKFVFREKEIMKKEQQSQNWIVKESRSGPSLNCTGWPKMNEGVLIRYNFLFET